MDGNSKTAALRVVVALGVGAVSYVVDPSSGGTPAAYAQVAGGGGDSGGGGSGGPGECPNGMCGSPVQDGGGSGSGSGSGMLVALLGELGITW
jgi:hypothetical protein